MTFPSVKSVFSSGLIAVYFVGQVAFGSAAETNFWADRQRTQMAALPGSAQPLFDATAVLKQIPALEHSQPLGQNRQTNVSTKLQALLDSIPFTAGSIQEVYDAGNTATASVILLQDVHLNTEAQTNIAATLQSLIDTDRVGVVGVEGAFAPFDFTRYRAFPDRQINKNVAANFVAKNLLAAPSYVGVTSDRAPPLFVGVDDRSHYRKNVQAYLASRDSKQSIAEKLGALSRQLQQRKQKIFSPALLAFDALRSGYRKGDVTLSVYVKKLMAFNAQTDLIIDQFAEASEMESRLNFSRVEAQRKTVVEKLIRQLNDAEIKALVQHSLLYRVGKISFGSYYRYLNALCADKRIALNQTPEFDNYIRYVLLSDGIKADKLFASIAAWESRILEALAKSSIEKQLAQASDENDLLAKLIEFGLTSSEWEKYQRQKPSLVGWPTPNVSAFESFYEEAEIRSAHMAKALLTSTSPKSKILVLGGFHTSGVAQLLRQQKISYAVVSPKITKVNSDGADAYLSVFARERTPLDKLLVGEKLFLSPTAVQLQPGEPVAEVLLPADLALATMQANLELPVQTGVVENDDRSSVELTVADLSAASSLQAGYSKVADLPSGGVVQRSWIYRLLRIVKRFTSTKTNVQNISPTTVLRITEIRSNGDYRQALWRILRDAKIAQDISASDEVGYALLELIKNAVDAVRLSSGQAIETSATKIRVSATYNPQKKTLDFEIRNPGAINADAITIQMLEDQADILRALIYFGRPITDPFPALNDPVYLQHKRNIFRMAGLNEKEQQKVAGDELDVAFRRIDQVRRDKTSLQATLAAIERAIEKKQDGSFNTDDAMALFALRGFSTKTKRFINSYFMLLTPRLDGSGHVAGFRVSNHALFPEDVGGTAGIGLAVVLYRAQEQGFQVSLRNERNSTVATIHVPSDLIEDSVQPGRKAFTQWLDRRETLGAETTGDAQKKPNPGLITLKELRAAQALTAAESEAVERGVITHFFSMYQSSQKKLFPTQVDPTQILWSMAEKHVSFADSLTVSKAPSPAEILIKFVKVFEPRPASGLPEWYWTGLASKDGFFNGITDALGIDGAIKFLQAAQIELESSDGKYQREAALIVPSIRSYLLAGILNHPAYQPDQVSASRQVPLHSIAFLPMLGDAWPSIAAYFMAAFAAWSGYKIFQRQKANRLKKDQPADDTHDYDALMAELTADIDQKFAATVTAMKNQDAPDLQAAQAWLAPILKTLNDAGQFSDQELEQLAPKLVSLYSKKIHLIQRETGLNLSEDEGSGQTMGRMSLESETGGLVRTGETAKEKIVTQAYGLWNEHFRFKRVSADTLKKLNAIARQRFEEQITKPYGIKLLDEGTGHPQKILLMIALLKLLPEHMLSSEMMAERLQNGVRLDAPRLTSTRGGHYNEAEKLLGMQATPYSVWEFMEVFIHEMGHVVEAEHLSEDSQLRDAFELADADDNIYKVASSGTQAKNRQRYLQRSPTELFAETFMHYVLHNPLLRNGFEGKTRDSALWKDVHDYYQQMVFKDVSDPNYYALTTLERGDYVLVTRQQAQFLQAFHLASANLPVPPLADVVVDQNEIYANLREYQAAEKTGLLDGDDDDEELMPTDEKADAFYATVTAAQPNWRTEKDNGLDDINSLVRRVALFVELNGAAGISVQPVLGRSEPAETFLAPVFAGEPTSTLRLSIYQARTTSLFDNQDVTLNRAAVEIRKSQLRGDVQALERINHIAKALSSALTLLLNPEVRTQRHLLLESEFSSMMVGHSYRAMVRDSLRSILGRPKPLSNEAFEYYSADPARLQAVLTSDFLLDLIEAMASKGGSEDVIFRTLMGRETNLIRFVNGYLENRFQLEAGTPSQQTLAREKLADSHRFYAAKAAGPVKRFMRSETNPTDGIWTRVEEHAIADMTTAETPFEIVPAAEAGTVDEFIAQAAARDSSKIYLYPQVMRTPSASLLVLAVRNGRPEIYINSVTYSKTAGIPLFRQVHGYRVRTNGQQITTRWMVKDEVEMIAYLPFEADLEFYTMLISERLPVQEKALTDQAQGELFVKLGIAFDDAGRQVVAGKDGFTVNNVEADRTVPRWNPKNKEFKDGKDQPSPTLYSLGAPLALLAAWAGNDPNFFAMVFSSPLITGIAIAILTSLVVYHRYKNRRPSSGITTGMTGSKRNQNMDQFILDQVHAQNLPNPEVLDVGVGYWPPTTKDLSRLLGPNASVFGVDNNIPASSLVFRMNKHTYRAFFDEANRLMYILDADMQDKQLLKDLKTDLSLAHQAVIEFNKPNSRIQKDPLQKYLAGFAQLRKADIISDDLPARFGNQKMDIIRVANVFVHLNGKQAQQALKNLASLLKPNGQLIIGNDATFVIFRNSRSGLIATDVFRRVNEELAAISSLDPISRKAFFSYGRAKPFVENPRWNGIVTAIKAIDGAAMEAIDYNENEHGPGKIPVLESMSAHMAIHLQNQGWPVKYPVSGYIQLSLETLQPPQSSDLVLRDNLVAFIQGSAEQRREAAESIIDGVAPESMFKNSASASSSSKQRLALARDVKNQLMALARSGAFQTPVEKAQLADLVFVLRSVLTDSEARGFIGTLGDLTVANKGQPTRELASWTSSANEAQTLVNNVFPRTAGRGSRARLVIGFDQAGSAASELIALRATARIQELERTGQLVFVGADNSVTALQFINEARSHVSDLAPGQKLELLMQEGAILPPNFLALSADERRLLEQQAVIYFITRALQSIEISTSLLPDWNALRTQLIQA